MITPMQLQPIVTGALPAVTAMGALVQLKGVNLAGADFGSKIPGTLNTDYTFPPLTEHTYYTGKGMRIIRLPFLWERIQPTLGGSLNAGHISWLTSFAQANPAISILFDLHSYGGYGGHQIGTTGGPTQAQFASFWGQMATTFGGFPNVMFGLMNEPAAPSLAAWLTSTNMAIAAIRAAGALNQITVPGLSSTGAWTWLTSGNAATMVGVVDPSNNYIYEVHQYFDADGSGSHPDAVSATIGSQRLAAVTTWARTYGRRLLLGEFGAATNATMLAALMDCVAYMQTNADVWAGWTYWAGGPWWGSYDYSIEPTNIGQPTQADSAQMTALGPYL